MTDLLIELFSEEIPARMQIRAANDLKKLVTDGMVEAGLTYASAAAFSTPRRLTLTVEGMLDASPTTTEERKGPKVGAPEQAMASVYSLTALRSGQASTASAHALPSMCTRSLTFLWPDSTTAACTPFALRALHRSFHQITI